MSKLYTETTKGKPYTSERDNMHGVDPKKVDQGLEQIKNYTPEQVGQLIAKYKAGNPDDIRVRTVGAILKAAGYEV